jgi:hypothetical protein
MKINVKKIKSMVVSREGGRTVNLVRNGQVEQVKTFGYLEVIMTENGTCVEEAKARIAMTKVAFNKSKELLTKT